MKYLFKFIFPFPPFGRNWGTECLNTKFPVPTMLCAGYSVKLILIYFLCLGTFGRIILLILPKKIYISFTLYPAQCRVGRGNLMLRHSFPTFCRILEALCVEWQNSTPRLSSTPERRNGNINLSKYFISSSGDGTHNQSVLQSHFVPRRHDWPQIK